MKGKCVCGTMLTIEKVGKKTPWSCTQTKFLDPNPDPESVSENPDPSDPDPHQNAADPHHWFAGFCRRENLYGCLIFLVLFMINFLCFTATTINFILAPAELAPVELAPVELAPTIDRWSVTSI